MVRQNCQGKKQLQFINESVNKFVAETVLRLRLSWRNRNSFHHDCFSEGNSEKNND